MITTHDLDTMGTMENILTKLLEIVMVLKRDLRMVELLESLMVFSMVIMLVEQLEIVMDQSLDFSMVKK